MQLSFPIPLPPDPRILAARKLARMVAANKRSFETRDYVKRRAAALKGKRRG